jgi:hypothetical protein
MQTAARNLPVFSRSFHCPVCVVLSYVTVLSRCLISPRLRHITSSVRISLPVCYYSTALSLICRLSVLIMALNFKESRAGGGWVHYIWEVPITTGKASAGDVFSPAQREGHPSPVTSTGCLMGLSIVFTFP